jgi:N-acetylglucosaminyl-diphospho-decaprenol L-rhamnosyltransferase
MNRSISVVTVTHNSAHTVRGALARLPSGLEIVCVDNASTDDLSAALAGLVVHRIDNPVNLGFGQPATSERRRHLGNICCSSIPTCV